MLEPCRNGRHTLIDVYDASDASNAMGEVDTVRWCEYCGAIVVDSECDGRIKPGGVMRMRFPRFVLDNTGEQ